MQQILDEFIKDHVLQYCRQNNSTGNIFFLFQTLYESSDISLDSSMDNLYKCIILKGSDIQTKHKDAWQVNHVKWTVKYLLFLVEGT